MPNFFLFLTFFFSLSVSWGSDICAPVAQFSNIGKVKTSSVTFAKWTDKLAISEAQINTAKCKKINKTLSPDKHKLLEKLAVSKTPVLVLMEKLDEKKFSYCLIDAREPASLLSQPWITQEDECAKQNLIKVVFKGNRQSYYFPKDQIQILSSRKPERSRPRR